MLVKQQYCVSVSMDMHAWQQLPGATGAKNNCHGAEAIANHSQEPLDLSLITFL